MVFTTRVRCQRAWVCTAICHRLVKRPNTIKHTASALPHTDLPLQQEEVLYGTKILTSCAVVVTVQILKMPWKSSTSEHPEQNQNNCSSLNQTFTKRALIKQSRQMPSSGFNTPEQMLPPPPIILTKRGNERKRVHVHVRETDRRNVSLE